MGKDKLMSNEELGIRNSPSITLVAEQGASLSSGSLRLYALPYGCIDLYNYDPLNRRCAVGIMVATEYRRQGHALAMLQALADQYRSMLHTLYADIATTNTASIALFRKAGYTQCGHFKEWLLVNDQYIDSIRMQLIL
ncbi:MAG: GNAT family protein [Bacteroidales bacterium]|nr:GNAT family protein [Bacteroidales bacterium]